MQIKYKNKKIAEVTKDKIYKKVRKSKHLFRAMNAWGCDYNLIKDSPNDKLIHIYEIEEDINYYSTVKEYKEKGKVMDFGHGLQYFLALHKFETDEKMITIKEPQQARLI